MARALKCPDPELFRNRSPPAAALVAVPAGPVTGTLSHTFGILVMPPTRMTSPMSLLLTSASCMAFWHGATVLLIRSATMPSNCERLSFMFRCFGPEASIVRYGKLISVCSTKTDSVKSTHRKQGSPTQVSDQATGSVLPALKHRRACALKAQSPPGSRYVCILHFRQEVRKILLHISRLQLLSTNFNTPCYSEVPHGHGRSVLLLFTACVIVVYAHSLSVL